MIKTNNNPKIHLPKSTPRSDKYSNVPKPYLDVAEGMERQFTNHLLGEMRKTIEHTEPQSNAERIYQSMLDDERAKLMANSDTGLGVKETVLKRIYPGFNKQVRMNGLQQYNQNLNTNNSHKGENHE